MDILHFRSLDEIHLLLIGKGIEIIQKYIDQYPPVDGQPSHFSQWVEETAYESKELQEVDTFFDVAEEIDPLLQSTRNDEEVFKQYLLTNERAHKIINEFAIKYGVPVEGDITVADFWDTFFEAEDEFEQIENKYIQLGLKSFNELIAKELNFLTRDQKIITLQLMWLELENRLLQHKRNEESEEFTENEIEANTPFFHKELQNLIVAHSIALQENYSGEIPVPVPYGWKPEATNNKVTGKILLENTTAENTARCIMKILIDEHKHNANIAAISRSICAKFSFPNEDNKDSNIFASTIRKYRDVTANEALPENHAEIISLIRETVLHAVVEAEQRKKNLKKNRTKM